MEKQTYGEPHQNQETKNFNSKLWICVICAVLSVATVAVICLGIALFASNNKIAVLRTDLNGVNEKLEALNAENQGARSEISSLQSGQALIDERLEALNAESQGARSEISSLQSGQALIDEKLERLDEEYAQMKEPEDKIRIYIDQGHNPMPHHNSGATGNGLYEQDVTFLIGCVLADLLKSDGRFEVQLSRPNKSVVLGTDNKSSLMARVEGAAEFNADYLISLHTNSFTQNTASGIEVHVADKSSESYVFGESLLKGLIGSTNLRNRGMKLNPDLVILEYSSMPAALLELGFISNSGDAALLAEHPELFAKGIYNGILDYFGLLANN